MRQLLGDGGVMEHFRKYGDFKIREHITYRARKAG